MSLERLGGGVGTKESARSGDSKGGWQLKEGIAVLPARYLQHKGNVPQKYNKTVKRFFNTTEKITAQQQKANGTSSTVNAVTFSFVIMCVKSAHKLRTIQLRHPLDVNTLLMASVRGKAVAEMLLQLSDTMQLSIEQKLKGKSCTSTQLSSVTFPENTVNGSHKPSF